MSTDTFISLPFDLGLVVCPCLEPAAVAWGGIILGFSGFELASSKNIGVWEDRTGIPIGEKKIPKYPEEEELDEGWQPHLKSFGNYESACFYYFV